MRKKERKLCRHNWSMKKQHVARTVWGKRGAENGQFRMVFLMWQLHQNYEKLQLKGDTVVRSLESPSLRQKGSKDGTWFCMRNKTTKMCEDSDTLEETVAALSACVFTYSSSLQAFQPRSSPLSALMSSSDRLKSKICAMPAAFKSTWVWQKHHCGVKFMPKVHKHAMVFHTRPIYSCY